MSRKKKIGIVLVVAGLFAALMIGAMAGKNTESGGYDAATAGNPAMIKNYIEAVRLDLKQIESVL